MKYGIKSMFLLKKFSAALSIEIFNISGVVEVLLEIKKVIGELIEILERSKFKNIIWRNNPIISSILLIKKKSIEKNFRSLALYLSYRIKHIKILYWNNYFLFSKRDLKKYITHNEIIFAGKYNEILKSFIKTLKLSLFESKTTTYINFFVEIESKENIIYVKSKKKRFFLEKNSIYFLKCSEIDKMIQSKILLKFTNKS
ncbi:hypothetical protein CMESO_529 (nucleomorph) [Chroomonas mesostigmatica CCMP1168]|uniref:Uncharacterized protein n=1 Tax=Chroomonas mesostigmatica CCMP1168 TaxID=1195612 RepID=J7G8U6_9CRYP|nr:hypothetical protein CMESO_529 [Chroomonas mesostigmatica CCMP1168]